MSADLFGMSVTPLLKLSSQTLIMMAVLQMREAAMRLKSMELAALATAIEAAIDGDQDEATDALAEAARYRRNGV